MKISVVTVVRNGRDTIGHALASLRAQSHRDVEHIIQDGRSTDGTLDYLAGNADPCMFVQSASDIGIYDAINKGILRATGGVVGLLHSDDAFASDDVLAQVAAAFDDPAIDGVYGDLQYVASNGSGRIVRHWRAGEYSAQLLAWGWMPPHPTLYLRRSVFERAGLYDTSFRIAGDYDGMLRWLTVGQVRLAYLPQVMVQMKIGGVSNRSIGHMMRKSREDYRAIRRHGVGGVGTLIAKNLSKVPQLRTGGA